MNALLPPPTSSESPPKPDTSTALVAHRPFQSLRDVVAIQPGCSLQDVIDLEFSDRAIHSYLVVHLNSDPVPQPWWRYVRPKPGALIEINVLPRGGGGLRMILSVAILAAATAAAGPLGTALAGSAFGSAVGLTAGLATSLVTAGLSTIGMLALNALVPPEQPNLNDGSRSSPHYSLEGSRNALRPFGTPVPINLGRNRVFPILGAQNVPETNGDDQFLRMLLLWSEGENQLSDEKIGETPIAEFDEVQQEFVAGVDGSTPAWTLYPSDIFTEQIGAEVTKEGGPVTRTTQPETDQIIVEVFFGAGLIQIGKKTQDRITRTVQFQIETSPAGTNTWTDQGTETVSKKASKPFTIAKTIDLAKDQYDVRVTRLTDDDNRSNVSDACSWSALKSIQSDQAPINLKGICGSAIRILATGQSNGVIDTWNGVLESICLDWDTGTQTWIKRATRNPASLFRRFLQGPWRRRPVPDAKLNLASLEEWHEFCDAKGLTCDIFVDWAATAAEILNLIAACGLASWGRPDNRYTVSIDQPKPRTQMFTPRNSRGFQATKTFARPVHALRGTFKNENFDYRSDTILIPAPGYDETTAVEIDEIELVGVTTPEMAWLITSRRLAERILRSTSYELTIGWESLRSLKGDRVGVGNTSILAGAGFGRVKSVSDDGTNITEFELDNQILMSPGTEYGAIIRHGDNGDLTSIKIITVVGHASVITPDETLAIANGPSVGDLVSIGRRSAEIIDLLIKSVIPKSRTEAALQLVPYAPDVFTSEDGIPEEIPSQLTLPASFGLPIITSITSGEAAAHYSPDGTLILRAIVSIGADGSRPITRIQALNIRFREHQSDDRWTFLTLSPDDTTAILSEVEADTVIEVQARWAYRDGSSSAWSGVTLHTVEGPALPPPDPTTVYQDGDVIRWTGIIDPDHAGWLIRTSSVVGATWESADPFTEIAYSFDLINITLLPQNTVEILIKAINSSGLESENAVRTGVTFSTTAALYAISTSDKGGNGYPGTLSGGTVSGGQIVGISSTAMWPDPLAAAWPDPSAAGFDTSWDELVYETTWSVPSGALLSDRINIIYATQGEAKIEVRWSNDELVILADADVVSDYLADDDPAPSDDDAPPFAIVTGTTSRPWVAYRSSLKPVEGGVLHIRISIQGGNGVQPIIGQLIIKLEAEGFTETFPDTLVPVDGVYLTPSRELRRIVHAMGQATGSGSSVTFRTIEKDNPATGAKVQALDTAGTPVEVLADLFQTGV